MTTTDNTETAEFTLSAEQELRFEIDYEKEALLRLLEGTAEIFGTEVVAKRDYQLSGIKVALFTWHGCKIRLSGDYGQPYTGEETPMVKYLELHSQLEKQRDAVLQSSIGNGPRVLIAGPTDSGKSTLCRTLLSYASRRGKEVTHIDIDVGQSDIAFPGTMSAASITEPISIEEGFSFFSPLAFFYGHSSPSENVDLYKRYMERLAECVEHRLQSSLQARIGGFIVNSCGWVDGQGYDLLLHAITTFNIDRVLVLGDERLTASLLSSIKDIQKKAQTEQRPIPQIEIQRIPRSGGVVRRNSTFRQKTRDHRFHEYFYGPQNNLSPQASVIPFSDVSVYSIGSGMQAPESALPIGAQPTSNALRVKKEEPSSKLNCSILAVSHAETPEQLLHSNIAGIIYITKVDMERKEYTALMPSPGRLPKKLLITGSLKWFDEN